MILPLENHCAIVTGGGSGIGKAICLQVAEQGGAVAVLDINEAGAQAVAAAISAAGGRAIAIGCDVAATDKIQGIVLQVVAELGAPTMLFNVAALMKNAHIEDTDIALFNRILAVNLTGAFAMSQAVLPHLIANGGSILNISSMAGHLGLPYLAAYCASKGGMVAMTKSMAKELSNRGVRVNVLAPGGVDTPMLYAPYPDVTAPEVMRLIPLSPIGVTPPEAIARVAIFVASPASGNLSGALIPIDGAST
ncbi:MAG: 3-oxoacyl-ACP reductase [Rhodospirillales bacterium]|nr:3-oxoacyl-ACP reductase [Rhodospirillales bacterium]